MNRSLALMLLAECSGDDIWSIAHCRLRRVPEAWIYELKDAFESGHTSDCETIYVGQNRVNQYEGIRDVDLARKLADFLNVRLDRIADSGSDRQSLVKAIKESIEEG